MPQSRPPPPPPPLRLPRLDPDRQTWMRAPETLAVLRALSGNASDRGAADGALARFVGGCVRDALAGRMGAGADIDIDIATPLLPEEVTRRLEAAGLRAVPTGIAHGTVTAVVNRRPFEITTLRRDVETDGRRAVVAFTTDWTEDAARRDFTFNALFAEPDGTLHDPFGGIADLKAGRVRFVGEADLRIREDVLRILRFCRFHARFGAGAPSGPDFEACVARRDLLPQLSAERVRRELSRLLACDRPVPTLEAMIARGLLAHWLPEAREVAALQAATARADAAGRRDWLRRLAVLAPVETRAAAHAQAERLRLSNAEAERLADFAEPSVPFHPDLPVAARREALYRIGRDRAWDLAILGAARAEGTGADPTPWQALMAEAEAWRPRDLPISGADALAAGLPPGPAVGRCLRAVETWWIARDFAPDRAACLDRLAAEAARLSADNGADAG
ncbi:CCA tRNA nucleotidyltransferase [Marivibrio halodurans]|uniref:CCA tRNA nucleotidyltransferase n=1 Tax=Marivibrio halodurans TaxID=2039722 RepID=A0A8J7V1E7_9PROT|nr:CCA tRNA nucleotidyltransferase [Marivibrio halodurans]MBP5856275.1 CCA tRNA nucleotidyltransferase [Marivibrio halodurans]